MDIDARLQSFGIRPVLGTRWLTMSEWEIQTVEQTLGVRLPDAYRTFLARYGAASFGHLMMFHALCPLPEALSSNGDSYVSFFYGPVSECYGRTYALRDVIHDLKERMPETLIPIAGHPGGDQICLGIRGEEAGKVYYWDHEHEWDEEDYLEQGLPVPPDLKFQNVHRIADSFEDFIARLYVVEA